MVKQKPEGATQLNIRVEKAIKVQLEESAKARGNSLNFEIKERLTRSLRPKPYWEALENPKIQGLVDLIALTTYATVHKSEAWYDDPVAFNQVSEAITRTVDALRPPGDTSISDGGPDVETYRHIGALIARKILRGVASADRLPPELTERVTELRKKLGAMVDRVAENLEKSS
jgi:hypothetical protein